MNYYTDFSATGTRGMQSYFDYVAERLGVGGRSAPEPEVLEFTGNETVEVSEIQPRFGVRTR